MLLDLCWWQLAILPWEQMHFVECCKGWFMIQNKGGNRSWLHLLNNLLHPKIEAVKGILLRSHKNNFWYNSKVRAIPTSDNWTGCESLDERIRFLLCIFSATLSVSRVSLCCMWNNWCLKAKVADWDYTRRHFSLNTLYRRGAVCSKYISGSKP